MLINLSERHFKPFLSLTSLYTMRTRTRMGADQRVIGFDPQSADDRRRLRRLRHPPALEIWHAAYDQDGRWDAALATAAARAAIARPGATPP